MGFGDGELVTVEFGQLGGEAEEFLHADGEVGSVEERSALLRFGLHFRQLGVPAGSADDDASSDGEDGAHVFDCRFWGGEVNDCVDAGEGGSGESGGVEVFREIENADAVASARGPPGRQASRFCLCQERGRAWEPQELRASSLQLSAISFQLMISVQPHFIRHRLGKQPKVIWMAAISRRPRRTNRCFGSGTDACVLIVHNL